MRSFSGTRLGSIGLRYVNAKLVMVMRSFILRFKENLKEYLDLHLNAGLKYLPPAFLDEVR